MKTLHKQKKYQFAIQLVLSQYYISPNDLEKKCIPRQYIHKLEKEGYIQKFSRGVYISNAFAEEPGFASYLLACKQIPSCIICLLSALEYYGVTTQIPHQIWIAVEENYKMPRNFPFPLKIIRMSKNSLNAGVETKKVAGNEYRIFNLAKTIADCFKYRTKIGLDVAMEALHDGLRKKIVTPDQIYKYSKINRVTKIVKPYLEYAKNG